METPERSLATARSEVPLCIRLFGGFELSQNSLPLPRTRSRTEQWLLALLLLRGHAGCERAWLAATFWPDSREEQALNNLRRSLSNLRQVLGEEAYRLLSPTPRTLAMDLSGLSCDLIEFDAALQQGDKASLEHAVALYRGPLLPGCEEAWLLPERQAREHACLSALETLAARSLQTGNPTEAVPFLHRILVLDPYRETALSRLMEALDAGGHRAEALLSYRRFRLLLNEQLQVEPAPETTALYQRLKRGSLKARTEEREQPPDVQPAASKAVSRLYIPRPVSDLVGREQERTEVASLLLSARLVTLTGSGGIGKTRLALATAEEVADAFPEGIWFVDLAPLSDPAMVAQAVATRLGVREEAGRPLVQTLIAFLQNRRSLLLMDNCEHLLSACAALITELLEPLPDLCVLATSREALGITGEHAWRVPSLPLAPLSSSRPAENLAASLLEYAGSQLFLERALEASSSFLLTEKNAPSVLQICHRLDGIPLAIELAAARVRVLSVEQISARLEDAFRLLTGGSRTVLPRHQTLRALIDWSFDLLEESEKLLLSRLAVFSGGWTLEAAEHVCSDPSKREKAKGKSGEDTFPGVPAPAVVSAPPGSPPPPLVRGGGVVRGVEGPRGWDDLPSFPSIEEGEVLDLLTSLIDKSLVIAETSSTSVRYCLLETVRQYARERLAESGEENAYRERHLRFYVSLVERLVRSHTQALFMTALEKDHDNLRSALSFCVTGEKAQVEMGLGIASRLQPFWGIGGYTREGREWLEALLERYTGHETEFRANALAHVGELARMQGDDNAARRYLLESVAIWKQLGNRGAIAFALNNLGWLELQAGDLEAARRWHQEALDVSRKAGIPVQEAFSLTRLGAVATAEEKFDEAADLLERALTHWRSIGYASGTAHALVYQGELMRLQKQRDAAKESLGEAVRLCESVGDLRVLVLAFKELVPLAAEERQWERAASLHGALETLQSRSGFLLQGTEAVRYEQDLFPVRQEIGQEAFETARSLGRAMTLEQAIALALNAEATRD